MKCRLVPEARRLRVALLVALLSVLACMPAPAGGQPPARSGLPAWSQPRRDPPRIRPGAVELGIAGSLTVVEGNARSTVAVRAGRFARAGAGLAGLELEAAHSHVSSLDVLDLQLALSWQRPLAETSLHPYLALAGGLRQEWLGSFQEARYPVGADAGVRALFSPRAAVRFEYRFRRVLGDPVADYSEHHLLTGLSLFVRN